MVGMAWAYLIIRFALAGAFPRTRKLIKKVKRSKKRGGSSDPGLRGVVLGRQ